MKKYLLKCVKNFSLNLYNDPEFAAIFWPDVESDLTSKKIIEENNDEILTIKMYPGDQFEIEWLGFELFEDDIINNVSITQLTNYSHIKGSTIMSEGWIPKTVIDFNRCHLEQILIEKLSK